MRYVPALLVCLLLSACLPQHSRDCGLYDFDCDSAPAAGDAALIEPAPRPAAEKSHATPQPDESLEARLRTLEAEVERLRAVEAELAELRALIGRAEKKP